MGENDFITENKNQMERQKLQTKAEKTTIPEDGNHLWNGSGQKTAGKNQAAESQVYLQMAEKGYRMKETGSGIIETDSGTIETGSGTIETGSGTIETGSGSIEMNFQITETDQEDAFADALFMEEQPTVQAGYFRIFGLASLLYAIVYTICMFHNSSGITMPVWILSTIVYSCTVMKKLKENQLQKDTGMTNGPHPDRRSACLRTGSWFYILTMLLLGISTFLTDNVYIIWLNNMGFFVFLILFLLHNFYDDSQWDFSKCLTEILTAVFGGIGCMIVPFTDGYMCWREKKAGKNKTFRAVLTGLLLAAPALLFLGICLMCADAVFQAMVTQLFAGLRFPVKIMEAVGMLLFGFFSSYCGMRYLVRRSRIRMKTYKTAFDPVIAMTFSGLLLMMYMVFCGVQVLYLFAGSQTLPQGITYAQYAHRGFYMLLFVCMVNLVLVLAVRKYFAVHKILDGILLLICMCTYVMLSSSAYRMMLYMKVYQLTFLRVFVMAVLGALAFLMAGVIILIVRPQFPLFRYSITVVSIIYLCLAFSHVDYFIASYNLSHAQNNHNMDWEYLACLSLDAAPAVAEYYENAPQDVRERMHAQAVQVKMMSGYGSDRNGLQEGNWFADYMHQVCLAEKTLGLRNFNVSRYRAVRLSEAFNEP